MGTTTFPLKQELVLNVGNTHIGIIPQLCLVSHFQVGKWQVLYRPEQTQNVKRWGIPLMIPNFGRLKDDLFLETHTKLPAHGFGRNLPWSLINQTQEEISIQLTSNEQTYALYPYNFIFTVTIGIAEGKLLYRLQMENQSKVPMPIAPGLHPYFTVVQSLKSSIITDGIAGFSAQNINWDQQPPDTHYPFPHKITATIPQAGQLTIREVPQNGEYSLARLQIWSETIDAPDHDFVCLEPVVASADGLNRPADRLTIAPAHKHTIEVIFEALPD